MLFISAYSPLLLIFVIKGFDFETFKFGNPTVSIILIVISCLSIILLLAIVESIPFGNMAIEITGIKNNSIDVISYTIPYLFCAFDVDLNNISDVITIVIFLIILMILSITTKTLFINPVLAIFGYVFYEIDYIFDGKQNNKSIVTNIDIRIGDKIHVRNLSRFLFILTPKKYTR